MFNSGPEGRTPNENQIHRAARGRGTFGCGLFWPVDIRKTESCGTGNTLSRRRIALAIAAAPLAYRLGDSQRACGVWGLPHSRCIPFFGDYCAIR